MKTFKRITQGFSDPNYRKIKSYIEEPFDYKVDGTKGRDKEKIVTIYKVEDYFIYYTHRKHLDINVQIEFPIEAGKWLADSIENKFWKKPSEGGLARNEHRVVTEINDEKIDIIPSLVYGPEFPGYEFTNYARNEDTGEKTVIVDGIAEWPQSGNFTTWLLKNSDILEVLRNIENL